MDVYWGDPGDDGFEGPEKRLELSFHVHADVPTGLRSLPRSHWEAVCSAVNATILSEMHNDWHDAYLLSESTLMVYDYTVILLTCGKTTLLNALPLVMEGAKSCKMDFDWVQFSRKNFTYAHAQPAPHCSFDHEVKVLKKVFPQGSPFVLGPLDSDHCFIFWADAEGFDYSAELPKDLPQDQQILTVQMHNMRPRTAALFTTQEGSGHDAKAVTELSGIAGLFPDAVIDAYLFQPCGYSCNASMGRFYFTIHVTPEEACSYASFESNAPVDTFWPLIQKVLEVFGPERAVTVELTDVASPVGTQRAGDGDDSGGEGGRPSGVPGYKTKNVVSTEAEPGYIVVMRSLLRDREVSSEDGGEQAGKIVSSMTATADKAGNQADRSPSSFYVSSLYGPALLLSMQEIRAGRQRWGPRNLTVERGAADGSSLIWLPDLEQKYLALGVQPRGIAYGAPRGPRATAITVARAVDTEIKTGRHLSQGCLLLSDLGAVLRRLVVWKQLCPVAIPCHEMRLDTSPALLETLTRCGVTFDVRNKHEAAAAMASGAAVSDLIFAKPLKTSLSIGQARQTGIALVTFESESELTRLSKQHPDARLLIRVCVDSEDASNGDAAAAEGDVTGDGPALRAPGCHAIDAVALLEKASELRMDVVGLSVWMAPKAADSDTSRYTNAITLAKRLSMQLKASGFPFEARLVNLCGGLPETDVEFASALKAINDCVESEFPLTQESCVRFILDAGRSLVASASWLVARVEAVESIDGPIDNVPHLPPFTVEDDFVLDADDAVPNAVEVATAAAAALGLGRSQPMQQAPSVAQSGSAVRVQSYAVPFAAAAYFRDVGFNGTTNDKPRPDDDSTDIDATSHAWHRPKPQWTLSTVSSMVGPDSRRVSDVGGFSPSVDQPSQAAEAFSVITLPQDTNINTETDTNTSDGTEHGQRTQAVTAMLPPLAVGDWIMLQGAVLPESPFDDISIPKVHTITSPPAELAPPED